MITNQDKKWYIDAVRSSLILRGLHAEVADQGIERFKLKERLDRWPEDQFHDDVVDVADDICRDYITT